MVTYLGNDWEFGIGNNQLFGEGAFAMFSRAAKQVSMYVVSVIA